MYDWMGEKVQSRYAPIWLVGFFFIEAFCFPIPADPLLILFCIENRSRALYYAAIATIASVLGGLIGYMIGACMWETVGHFFTTKIISPMAFERARHTYETYQSWAVLIAGFSPLPYKAVTLTAGFCRLPIVPFIVYSIIARSARFFLVAIAIRVWGAHIKVFIDRYFNQLVLLFVVLIVGFVWLLT
jgi:membrane protein YqaA with SNARE-associated domain